MTTKMTWDERRDMHSGLWRQHRAASMEALNQFQATREWKYFEEYRAEDRLANKHFGIVRAMYTRRSKQLDRLYGRL